MPDLVAIVRAVAIALVCAGALAATAWLTEDRIEFNEAAALRSAIADLLPTGEQAPAYPPEIDRVPGLWALCSGHLLGRSNVPGYGGDIRLLYSLHGSSPLPAGSANPKLVRLSVLGHQETPGIADFLTDPAWLNEFAEAEADQIAALSAITGATITSVAVRDHLAGVLSAPQEQLGQPVAADCSR